jgi:precorrin-2 dehydrogenase/sirohydrochlorin ferrochelatase
LKKKTSKPPAHPEAYYPVFLDLRGKPCVVVGGGRVAERKALALLAAGARLTVVSPALTVRLRKEKDGGRLRHVERAFRPGDLRGAFLVIAATDDEKVNEAVAARKDLLVNVVDRPEHCTFIVPASVRRGPLHVAISTSGTSPAMARAIREDMERTYGKEFGLYLRKLSRIRERAVQEIPDPRERERFLKTLASERIVKMLKRGKLPR